MIDSSIPSLLHYQEVSQGKVRVFSPGNLKSIYAAFVDAEAVVHCMPDAETWYEGLFESNDPNSWFSLMDADEPQPAGTANIVMPLATNGENVVLSHSGWGDGFYWLLQTKDADGNLTGIHIDLAVVGRFDEKPDDDEEALSTAAPVPEPARKSWLAKLLGR